MTAFEIVDGEGERIGSYRPHPGAQAAFMAEPYRSHPYAYTARDETPQEAIDWHATMRDRVAEASMLADRVAATDTDAGEALQRLCNVVAHLLDGNASITKALQYNTESLQILAERETARAKGTL